MGGIKSMVFVVILMFILVYNVQSSLSDHAKKSLASDYLCEIAQADQRDTPERTEFLKKCKK